MSYAFTDWFRLTVGERIARTELLARTTTRTATRTIGPRPAAGEPEGDPQHAQGDSVVPGRSAEPVLRELRQGLPRRRRQCAAAVVLRRRTSRPPATRTGRRSTYKSDNTQNYEIGSKNAFGNWLKIATSVYYIKWNDIQQSLYVAGDCGLQFTDNLGQADVWGGDLQAQMQFGPLHIDLAAGYTSARFSQDAPDRLPDAGGPDAGDPVPGQQWRCHLRPGRASTTPRAPCRRGRWPSGSSTTSTSAQRDAFVRADWEYESRNPWLANVQDPNNDATYNYGYSYTLPSTNFTSLRGGRELRPDWQLAAFCDNLFDSHTVNNYSLGQTDGTYTPQQNAYTFRPRTVGLNVTWHGH